MANNPVDRPDPIDDRINALAKSIPPEISIQISEFIRKLRTAFLVRNNYKKQWGWGAGAEYLYGEFLEAVGLEEYKDEILRSARPKRGRKEETELAMRILTLKAEGKTAPQIRSIFQAEGHACSLEKIESYLKTRRKRKKSAFYGDV